MRFKAEPVLVAIKAQVLGYNTVILENGDVLLTQTTIDKVRMVPGEKGPDGKQLYIFDFGHGTSLIEAKP